MRTIAVIDYGMGNLHSVAKAIEHVAGPQDRVLVSSRPDELRAADRLVFPGVGAMRDCMGEIRRLGLDELLREQVQRKPVLAVCVGMQALLEHSEENGGVHCIGLFKGQVRRFPAGRKDAQGCELKVPHMGWNEVRQTAPHPLWAGIPDGCRFYFVHSYYVKLDDPTQEVGRCDYHEPFTVAIAQPNLFAVQFHPEKSQDHGLRLYKNFLSWDGNN